MNIVLIGYRCTGKTTVGKVLADKTGKSFLDTDALVEEKAGSSIESLVLSQGWKTFRNIEKQIVEAVTKKDNHIIATGGGAVLDEDNVKNMTRNALVVWLDGDPEVLRERMKKEQHSSKFRPSITGADPLKEIQQVLSDRKSIYAGISALRVDTTSLTPDEAAARIGNALNDITKESHHAR